MKKNHVSTKRITQERRPRARFLPGLAVIACLLVAGCSNLFDPPVESSAAAGDGLVRIAIGDEAAARTVQPAGSTLAGYQLTFSSGHNPVNISGGTRADVYLADGTYTVTAAAYKAGGTIGSAGDLVAQGSITITLSGGAVTSDTGVVPPIILTSVGSGNGTLEYTITGSDAASGYMKLWDITGNPVGSFGTSGVLDTGFYSNLSDTVSLTAGCYITEIRLENGYSNVAFLREVVEIWPGTTTEITFNPAVYLDPSLAPVGSGDDNNPVIDNIIISKEASGNDTVITLTIDVSSNVPVNYRTGSFYGPNGNIWGGGGGYTFTETSTGHWRLVTTDTVSQFAPSGEYYYTNIKVRNAGQLESEAWTGELKVTITNSIIAQTPVIDSITISKEASGDDTVITLTIDVSSNVPVNYRTGSFYGPNGNIWGGGGGYTFAETSTGHWRLVTTDTVSQYAPSGEYYYTNIKVRNAGQLESEAWTSELKVAVTNSIIAQTPVIDNITISKEASGNDTVITLTIDVSSNVPVNYRTGSFYGPNGNIWGGGGGYTFTETSTGHWRLITTDTVSQYAPSGGYYYTNIKVRNAGQLESEAWTGELKVTIP
jgi:hypothetical protein